MKIKRTFADVTEDFASGVARVCGIYGLNPMLGRLYGILFMSPEPMHLGALAEATGAAKSTVSVAMRKLESLKMVRRHWRKGDRRDYYEAQTDLGAVLLDWLRMFVVPEIRMSEELYATLEGDLSAAASEQAEDWPDEAGLDVLRARAVMMREMTASGKLVLERIFALVDGAGGAFPANGLSALIGADLPESGQPRDAQDVAMKGDPS